MSGNPRLNRIYYCMRTRCLNPNFKEFKHYGGRGITICEEWVNPEIVALGRHGRVTKGWLAFKNWAMLNGYKDDLTLDRIDNNKGYSPDNCRWVTMKVQCNNTRRNHLITYKGKTQSLLSWCNELGLNYSTVRARLNKYHWTTERALESKD